MKDKSVKLRPEETILLSKKPASVPILLFGILSFGFISSVVVSYSHMYFQTMMQDISVILGAIFVVFCLHFCLLAVRTRYVLTDEKVFIRYGGIRPSTVSVRRSQISEISVEQSMIESLTGTGRVRVQTSSGDCVTLSSIPYAKEMAIELSKHMPQADINVNVKSRPQTSGTSWMSVEN